MNKKPCAHLIDEHVPVVVEGSGSVAERVYQGLQRSLCDGAEQRWHGERRPVDAPGLTALLVVNRATA